MAESNYNYISVTEFTERNPAADVSRYSSATLSGIISKASRDVDELLGYPLLVGDYANELHEGGIDPDGNLVVLCERRPVVTVSGCFLVKGTDEITLDLLDGTTPRYQVEDDYRFVFPNGEFTYQAASTVRSLFSLKGTQFFVRISYKAGYEASEIPSWGKDATELLVLHRLARGMNLAGATRVQQGGISLSFSEKREGFRAEAERLLRSHRRVS